VPERQGVFLSPACPRVAASDACALASTPAREGTPNLADRANLFLAASKQMIYLRDLQEKKTARLANCYSCVFHLNELELF
jgi:mitochondrial fission protein ELM1